MIGNSQKPTSLQWLAMGACGFFLALVIWGIATSGPNRTDIKGIPGPDKETTFKGPSLTASNWSTEVDQAQVPVLVDFWAPWCGPCLTLGPTISTLATEYEGKIVVAKCNVDAVGNDQITARYSIEVLPTIMILKNGKEIARLRGLKPKSDYNDLIKKALEAN